MNKKYRTLFILLPVFLCALGTALYAALFVLRDDVTPPEITVPEGVQEVSVTAEDAQLLEGITASDNRDGDITADLLVESVSHITEEHTAVLTCAAVDRAGNVTKSSRTIRYTDYTPPVFGVERALVFQENAAPDVLACLTAQDVVDGDISNRIKATLVSDTSSLSYAGIHRVEFRVTNSLGDTEYITLPIDIYESGSYNATVELSDYLVRIQKNSEFHPEDYLENLVVGVTKYPLDNQNPPYVELSEEEKIALAELGNERETEIRTYVDNYVDPRTNEDRFVRIVNVDIMSGVFIGKPGVYSVTYTVDMDGDYKGYTRLHVVVEE